MPRIAPISVNIFNDDARSISCAWQLKSAINVHMTSPHSMRFFVPLTALCLSMLGCGDDGGLIGPEIDDGVYVASSHVGNPFANDCTGTPIVVDTNPFVTFENGEIVLQIEGCNDEAAADCFPLFSGFNVGTTAGTKWTGHQASTSLSGGLCGRTWQVAEIDYGGAQVVLRISRFYEGETADDCPVPEGPPPASASCIEFDEWTLDRP